MIIVSAKDQRLWLATDHGGLRLTYFGVPEVAWSRTMAANLIRAWRQAMRAAGRRPYKLTVVGK